MKSSVAIAFFALAVVLALAAGGTPADTADAKAKPPHKESASTGSSAPSGKAGATLAEERARAFKMLDLDGYGSISLAEAAGNREIVTRFDRADTNRDGKLSRAEYDAMWTAKPLPRRQARAAPPSK